MKNFYLIDPNFGKQFYAFLVIVLLLFCSMQRVLAQPIFNGNAVLTTQASVNAFNFTAVTGDLKIAGSGITNLDSLDALHKVGGKLTIENCPNLQFVKPLQSLDSVGILRIANNAILKNLNGLGSLVYISGSLKITGNSLLENLTGLGPVRKLLTLEIADNANLKTIEGVDKLAECDVLLINNNPSLLNVDGLRSLLSLTHMQITMTGNPSMQNCCGLYNLWTSGTVYGVIDIANNGTDCSRDAVLFACDPNGTNCFATEVVNYSPGKTKNGSYIPFERNQPKKALGTPQENDLYNYVSLGFGGKLTVKLGADLYDNGTAEPDFILVETSYGLASTLCFEGGEQQYPESVFVELSQNGNSWVSLPNIHCRTTFIDIKPVIGVGSGKIAFARYVRLTDATNPFLFDGTADGFDVDGLIICPDQVALALERLVDARLSSDTQSAWNPNFYNQSPNDVQGESGMKKGIVVYPNPAQGDIINVDFIAHGQGKASLVMFDVMGRSVLQNELLIEKNENTVQVNISQLPKGQYVLSINMGALILSEKVTRK